MNKLLFRLTCTLAFIVPVQSNAQSAFEPLSNPHIITKFGNGYQKLGEQVDCTTGLCVTPLPTRPECVPDPRLCRFDRMDNSLFSLQSASSSTPIEKLNNDNVAGSVFSITSTSEAEAAVAVSQNFCSYDLDAGALTSCRLPIVGIVNYRANFAYGTATVIDDHFAVTARHVSTGKSTTIEECRQISSYLPGNYFISTESDLHSGATTYEAMFPILCAIDFPDKNVDLTLLKTNILSPPWRNSRYKILVKHDNARLTPDIAYHLTGYGLFDDFGRTDICSSSPKAGQRKIGIAREIECSSQKNCRVDIDFQMIHSAIDIVSSDTCDSDSGGAAMIEMTGDLEVDGTFALRGVTSRKPNDNHVCNAGSIAVDLSSPHIQDWIVNTIAQVTGDNPSVVRDRIIHAGDPSEDATYSQAVQTLINIDEATSTCGEN